MGEKKDIFRVKIVTAIVAVIILLSIGTFVYHILEDWSFTDSAYFTTMTLTTIGYGDFVPTHNVSKIFTIFFAFAGVGLFLFCMTIIAEHYFNQRVQGLEKTIINVGNKAQRAINKITPQKTENPTRRTFVKEMIIKHDSKSKKNN